jgi:hypothetical protein
MSRDKLILYALIGVVATVSFVIMHKLSNRL